jgi:uncharacterized membrane protein YhaH (DUF805 family)
MKFDQAIKRLFSNYATFSGRARRSEFWFAQLFLTLATVSATILDSVLFGVSMDSFGVLYSLFVLGTLIPALAVTWRRLHDMGKSGGFFFIALIPLVGWILIIVWLVTDSQPKANQYGPPVKK